ncbi:quinone-dependent dihydroorotate dehydrogenase [Rhodoferax sp.]|uniref:quinone-dependent dihydroorotate dehydrogenase n=1 Tax=Rhodoferax sp. TaxID=50421 RepID=UPI002615C8E7|nr:quinone-dependent dihydroorotate dehydrogenase [Rhodoferax sp.]MDD2811295.1 quinone-dependent dihydroorotate dehydrogenase [Rhodoferax sp.]MDD4944315.1 quinone-dependent dihydroorotate dehydrogenase [Rhodoferax sp.]MDD5480206.1 quinone-dependent dihydroorotate dehydrogenase [Rhodoferax sp.]
MSFVPYALTRAVLFGLDPEVAHELTLNTLARSQHSVLSRVYRNSFVSDPIELAGLKFPNRVGLAAGLDKNARCIDGFAAMGFGFVEVGTVTPLPQSGNPKPRMFRLPQAQGLINRLGFNNDGVDAFLNNVRNSKLYQYRRDHPELAPPMLLGLNIGKNASTPIERATDDYLTCLNAVYPHADYVTVNISSPNTKNLRTLQNDDALDALLGAISAQRELLAKEHNKLTPIFLKIAPDLDETQITVIAKTLRRYGLNDQGEVNNAWGVIATNTTLSRDAVKGMPHADEAGGLSGAPVLAMSNRVIAQLRASLGKAFPIIGVGGIMSAADAMSKIRAGADVVQIYTGLIYQGPDLVSEAALMIKNASHT